LANIAADLDDALASRRMTGPLVYRARMPR
jgi:hypothetical protein